MASLVLNLAFLGLAAYTGAFLVLLVRGRVTSWKPGWGFIYSADERADAAIAALFAPACRLAMVFGVERLAQPGRSLK